MLSESRKGIGRCTEQGGAGRPSGSVTSQGPGPTRLCMTPWPWGRASHSCTTASADLRSTCASNGPEQQVVFLHRSPLVKEEAFPRSPKPTLSLCSWSPQFPQSGCRDIILDSSPSPLFPLFSMAYPFWFWIICLLPSISMCTILISILINSYLSPCFQFIFYIATQMIFQNTNLIMSPSCLKPFGGS